MITILAAPKSPALAQDDNWLVLQTSLTVGGNRPGFAISGLPADGDVLNLRWGNIIVNITFKTTPALPYELRAAAAQTQGEYLAQLLEGLYSIPEIEADFILENRTTDVRLFLRNALNGDLNGSSSANIGLTVFSATETTHPNLSAAVNVYQAGDPNPLRLKAAYDNTGRTEINLANIIPLELGVPPQQYVAYTGAFGSFQPAGWAEYFLRYADQYGRPPQAEKLTKSANYVMVAGGSGPRTLRRWTPSGGLQLCHAYLDVVDQYFAKPITYDQPDWCYVFADTSATLTPFAKVIYSDGTSDRFAVPGGGAVAVQRGLYAWPCGPAQVQLDTAANWATKTPVRYVFELSGSSIMISYELVLEHYPWEVYLAYENGAGGIESVGMRGKPTEGISTEKQAFRRARTRVQGKEQGEQGEYNAEGVRTYRLRSGYISAAYARHLAQLALGRVWIVDARHLRLIPVIVSGSIDLTTEDDDLHSIEITCREANAGQSAQLL